MPEEEILQHIFSHASLEDITVEDLQNITRQYPYFSIGQLLLVKKNFQLQPAEYSRRLRLASLYTNNPFALHQYFFPEKAVTGFETSEEENTAAEVLSETGFSQQEKINDENFLPEKPNEGIANLPEEILERENVQEEIAQPSEIKNEVIAEQINSVGQSQEIENETSAEEINSATQSKEIVNEPPATEIPQPEEIKLSAETEHIILEQEIIPDENAQEKNAEIILLPEEEIISSSQENNITAEKIEEEKINEEEVSALENMVNETEPINKNEDWLIRPLYTEDYFAHQGIKLPEIIDSSKKPTEAQLRSFTDWLRSTRRPRGSADPDNPDAIHSSTLQSLYQAEEDGEVTPEVEKMAIASITTHENITTEAMAEVRRHQGQREKAIAIYEKLSLLNPGKSDYFAQKIEELKRK